jgi:hypothetical protein
MGLPAGLPVPVADVPLLSIVRIGLMTAVKYDFKFHVAVSEDH